MRRRARGARQLVLRLFPDKREVIFRTDGRVRYLSIPRSTQMALAAALVVGAGWGAFATYGFIGAAGQAEALTRAQQTIGELRAEQERLQTALNEVGPPYTGPLHGTDGLLFRVAAVESDIDRLLDIRRELEKALSNSDPAASDIELPAPQAVAAMAPPDRAEFGMERALRAEIRSLRKEASLAAAARARVAKERTTLQDKVAYLEEQLGKNITLRRSNHGKVRELETQIASLEKDRVVWQGERDRLAGRVDTLGVVLARLGTVNRSLLSTLDRRTRERDDLNTQASRLRDRLVKLQRDQVGVLARLDARTSDSVEVMKRIVTMTGLDLDQMLDRVGAPPIGRGGPFLAFASNEPGLLLENQLDELDARVKQWRGLRDLIEQLPLTAPLDGYQVTSAYGGRKDPFTGRLAMHEGTDFIGRSRALVLAPAPGRVTNVGWNGGYGKMVEIDHGFGIRTRYAHMNKIYVKRGQEIDFRQRLGQMGSSGRSTAEHLHYEIHVDGVPIDPEGFLRAGVFAFSG